MNLSEAHYNLAKLLELAISDNLLDLFGDELNDLAELIKENQLAANRWNALVNCAHIRVLGSAGLESELNPYGKPHGNYGHMGMEIWTIYETANPVDNSLGQKWLTKFADKAIEANKYENKNSTSI